MSIVDAMVGNFIDIDWVVFSLWLEGYSVGESAHAVREKQPELAQSLLIPDLSDQYRLFTMLEPLLHQPGMFSEQLVWQLDVETQQKLISLYYALDNSVARELLGRKLSSRLRKDLDEISEKTGVSLRSCRRQFENIKRVFKEVEDMPGSYYNSIRKEFCLPEKLAERYSVLVFVASHRFETCKKKLAPLSFEDFAVVSRSMMKEWSTGVDVDEDGEPTFDRDLFNSLRDVRVLVDKEKDLRYAVCQRLGRGVLSPRSLAEIEANFKSYNRNILSIVQTLYHNKEIKDLFVNIVDKVIDPFKQSRLTLKDVQLLLTAYQAAVLDLPLDPELRGNFDRVQRTLGLMISTFYRSLQNTL